MKGPPGLEPTLSASHDGVGPRRMVRWRGGCLCLLIGRARRAQGPGPVPAAALGSGNMKTEETQPPRGALGERGAQKRARWQAPCRGVQGGALGGTRSWERCCPRSCEGRAGVGPAPVGGRRPGQAPGWQGHGPTFPPGRSAREAGTWGCLSLLRPPWQNPTDWPARPTETAPTAPGWGPRSRRRPVSFRAGLAPWLPAVRVRPRCLSLCPDRLCS